MAHVFISYKHTDSDGFAYNLRQSLQNAGFQVWMDEDLRAGDDWRTEIDLAIQNAFALIVIMTPEARQSEYVTYEWACARGAEKPIIPLLWKSTELHPRLEAFQYIDFTRSDYQASVDKLISRLRTDEEQSTMYNVPRDAPVAVKRAVAALDSNRADERKEAIETLAQINHPSAREALVASLHHHIRDVRTNARLSLWDVLNRDIHNESELAALVPGLVLALNNINAKEESDRELRQSIAHTLGEIVDSSAVPGLVEVLADEDYLVRQAAAEALGEIGDASAVPGLIAVLDDWNGPEAAEALEKIGTPEALDAAKEWRLDSPLGRAQRARKM